MIRTSASVSSLALCKPRASGDDPIMLDRYVPADK